VAQAAAAGIQVLAITDHDTTSGVPAALAEARRTGITVVPGVEISSISGTTEIHILGYFVDLQNAELQSLLAHTRQARRERAKKMTARLESLGMPLAWERVLDAARASDSIGRPHVAAALLEAGHVQTWDEAFGLWIGRGCPAYVERPKLSPAEAVAVIRHSQGIPVLAHPYIYSRGGQCRVSLDLQRWLPRLRRAGLLGIEVYYPNYPRGINHQLLTLAVRYGLLITGGSDFHGGATGNGLGSVAVPWAAWEGIERRRRV
jgi:3',5'-nucleoside bisphosphate phosphatase